MNLPTKITFSRIILIAGMIIALFVMSLVPFTSPVIFQVGEIKVDLVFFIICIIFLIASFTDYLDGHLARKNNQVTALGKFLDPVADKLLVNSICIFLIAPQIVAKYNTTNPLNISAWCVIILVARDIVIDCLRQVAAQKNIVLAANMFGKVKTVLEMIAIVAILLNDFPFFFVDPYLPEGLKIGNILTYLAVLASIVSLVVYLAQNFHVFKENKESK